MKRKAEKGLEERKEEGGKDVVEGERGKGT